MEIIVGLFAIVCALVSCYVTGYGFARGYRRGNK